MALRASTGPKKDDCKDGMQTPARPREADHNQNALECLRLNILTSTALRPRAVNHARLSLDVTDISEINSPSRPSRLSRNLDSPLNPVHRHQIRRSVPLLGEIVGCMNNFNLRSRGHLYDDDDDNVFTAGNETQESRGDLSSLGILRNSEMLNQFDSSSGSKTSSLRSLKPPKVVQPSRGETIHLDLSHHHNSNTSFDLSHFLSSTSSNMNPISLRPNSLPANKLDNVEFKSADSSIIKEMFKRDEEEFNRENRPFSNQETNITYQPQDGVIRQSWVSPEKRSQMQEKRLTIGQYFKLKSSDIKELGQSFAGERTSPTKCPTPLPKGVRPGYIQGANQTIDLTGNDTARGTFIINDTIDSPTKHTHEDSPTLPGVDALSVSTITRLLDNANGCDTVVQNLLDLANKGDAREVSPSTSKKVPSPKKAASKLPRIQPRTAAPASPKSATLKGDNLIFKEVKIVGPRIVAQMCTLSVTVVNESVETLHCDLSDLVDCSGYSFSSQPPVMLLSKRKVTLQGSIVFHHAGEMTVNIGVKAMEIRSKRKSISEAPPIVVIVEPQIHLKTPYKDGIDFGLRPEDTQSMSPFEIISLGPSEIPICISIEQDCGVNAFFLVAPPEDGSETRLSTCLAFSLPGSENRGQATTFDIGVVFLAPSLESIPPHVKNEGDQKVTLHAQLVIEVEKHGGAPGLAPQERTVLAQCPIEGIIGLTQLLVSHNNLTLTPGHPQNMGLKNGGVVPLALHMTALLQGPTGSVVEQSIEIKPDEVLLLPGDEKVVALQWNANANDASSFNCELHLMYENLVEDHVVAIECRSEQIMPKEKLPLKTTRPHLAWGSIRPGETCKQTISYHNTSTETLPIWFKIKAADNHIVPFRILTDKEEVTTEFELLFKPMQKRNLTIMFCPTKLGPSCASLQMWPGPGNYMHKAIPLAGFGGNSRIVIRQISSSYDSLWLTLKPDFRDSVVGELTLYNEGTIAAFVKITGTMSITANDIVDLSISPDIMFVPPRGSVPVSVKLSGVKSILMRTASTEVKRLAVIHISSINEVTRRRIRNLIPSLTNKDLIGFLKSENGAGMHSLVKHVLDGEEGLVGEDLLEQLADFTGASASFLSKDLEVSDVELRAEGIGASKHLPELDTISSFVSMMDAPCNDVSMDLSCIRSVSREWGIMSNEVLLQSEFNYKSAVQIANFCDKELSLEIQCDGKLEISETVPKLTPFSSVMIYIKLKQDPQGQMLLEDGIVVYSKNDRVAINVRILPKPRQRMTVPPKKPLDTYSCGFLGHPSASPDRSISSSSGSTGSTKSWRSIESGSSSSTEDSKPKGLFPDCKVLIFPYTRKGQESVATITLFNPTPSDLKVTWNPPREPFRTTEDYIMVQGRWQSYIRVFFKPTIAKDVMGTIRMKVESNPSETFVIQLQGLTDNH